MSNDAVRQRQIQQLLKKALDIPAEQRMEFVGISAGDDHELAAQVIELLGYDSERTGGLTASIRAVAGDLRATETENYIGQQVGSYRITEKLEEGGMGSVFIAEHMASDFDQTVAIKLLPRHRLSEDAHRRFVDERRIQAGLNHPNIAQLIDGGTLADGIPYIVMEFIDGLTIDKYCDQNGLRHTEIIALVRKVCAALQFAHRKLVIHRDIKPSNIIVTEDGTPKLLDFGIAKLLEEDADAQATQAEQRMLTPMYASPEQLEGMPITTAADVYGVGLLLYRLLTRQMPYVPTSARPRDIEMAILSQNPQKPSRAVQSAAADGSTSFEWSQRRRKALRGDLDTILLTALKKEPERRYASVAAFNKDLENYLHNRPVSARPDSTLYVLRKFVRRHQWSVALGVTVVAAGLSMIAYYTHQLRIERDVASETAAFLSDLFQGRDPYQRNKEGLTVATLVDEGLRKLQANDALSPEVRVRLLSTIEQVNRNTGELDTASELAEEALALAEAHAGENSAVVLPALINLAQVRRMQDEHKAALQLAERYLRIAERTKGKKSPEVAQATHLLSIETYRTGDLEAMGRWAQRTYDLRNEIYGEHDRARSVGATALALYYWQTDQTVKARTLYEEAAEIQAAQDERNLMNEANLLHNIGLLYNDSGDYAGAVERYQQSLELRRKAASPNDPIMPTTLYSLAHSQSELGDKVAAHRTFLQQLPLQVAVAGRDKHFVAYSLTGHGMLVEEMGDPDSARTLLLEADRIWDLQPDPQHPDRATTWIGLARIAALQQDWARARSLMQQAIQLRRDMLGSEDLSTLRAEVTMAKIKFLQGEATQAAAELDNICKRLQAGNNKNHPVMAEAKALRGRIALAAGDTTVAAGLLLQARQMLSESLPDTHHTLAQFALWEADARLAAGQINEGTSLRQHWAPILLRAKSEWQSVLRSKPVPEINDYLGRESV